MTQIETVAQTLEHSAFAVTSAVILWLNDTRPRMRADRIIGTLYRAERVYAKVLDLEQTIKFFEETGQAQELFRMAPVRERLNQAVKELVADGQPVPTGIEYQITATLHIRKS